MATSYTRLYPPTVSGTIPPFYTDTITGTVTITVPFAMSKVVTVNEVGGFSLRIRDGETDIVYGYIDAYDWTLDGSNSTVNFVIPLTILSKMSIGRYYKL